MNANSRYSLAFFFSLIVLLPFVFIASVVSAPIRLETPTRVFGLGPLAFSAFSPDGRTAVSANGFGVYVWDVESGVVRRLPEQVSSVSALADNRLGLFASCDHEGMARVWEMESRVLLHEFSTGIESAPMLAISPDGERIAVGERMGAVTIFSTRDGQFVLQLIMPLRNDGMLPDILSSLGYSSDGSRILTTGYENVAMIWDAENGELLQTFNPPPDDLNTTTLAADISPDGRYLVTGSVHCHDGEETFDPCGGIVRLWRVEDGEILKVFYTPASVFWARFSPDGTQFIIQPYDHELTIIPMSVGQVRSIPDGELILTLDDYPNTRAFHYSADGMTMLLQGPYSRLIVVDTETWQPVQTLVGHAGEAQRAAFVGEGKWVFTAGYDHPPALWDASSGERIAELIQVELSGNIYDAAISPDGRRVVTTKAFHAALWDMGSGEMLLPIPGASYPIAFSPNGETFAHGTSWGVFQLRDGQSGKLLQEFSGHSYYPGSLAFHPSGDFLLVPGITSFTEERSSARLWYIDSGEMMYELYGEPTYHQALAFAPDGARFAAAFGDQAIYVWESVSGLLFHRHEIGQYVNSLAISPNGNWFMAGCFDGVARIYDLESGDLLYELASHDGQVDSAAFSPDGRWALTASSRGVRSAAMLWDLSTGVDAWAVYE